MQYLDISIPIPVYHPFTWLIGFGLVIALLARLAAAWPEIRSVLNAAKKTFWPANDAPAALLRKFALLASPIGILLFLVSIWRLYFLLVSPPEYDGNLNSVDDLRAHYLAFVGVGTFLIGLIGIPFAISRITAIERQTRTQEDSHVTDQINKAVEGLGADKTIKQQRINEGGKYVFGKNELGEIDFSKPIFEEISAPNIEVRLGAIYALERIARLNLDEHIHIMEILCAYVRENAKVVSLVPTENMKLRPKIRGDIQTVLTVIGRRKTIQKQKERDENFYLNFRDCDISGADLNGADFSGAIFINCQIEAAILRKAILTGTKFYGSLLNHTDFFQAKMLGTRLDRAIINRPFVVPGGMSESITMADIQAITVTGADISVINYLGEFEAKKKILGSRDTILHDHISFDIKEYEILYLKRRKAIRDGNDKEMENSEREMEEKDFFPSWFPYESTDMALGAEIERFLSRYACRDWPHS